MEKQKDKYVFVGTEYFLSSKSTGFGYLKLNNEPSKLETKYVFENDHEEFRKNNVIFTLDQEVFNRLLVTKVFDNNGVPGIISKRIPDEVCRDLVYVYNELDNEYSFDDNYINGYINEDYKLRIKERVI